MASEPAANSDHNAISAAGAGTVLGVNRSVTGQIWQYRTTDDRAIATLCQRAGLSEPLARILCGRNIGTAQVDDYLSPTLRYLLPDPDTLTDMVKGVKRLAQAIEAGESVAVFGDYDVDGATSSALLSKFFDHINQPYRVYIPDRQKEGYGPNVEAFRTLTADGAKVIVTVDCGTLSFEPIVAANAGGADVIVIDHHTPGEDLPAACALINPNRHDDLSDCGNLAAVGVTFMVLVALNRELRKSGFYTRKNLEEPKLVNLLDLVALGTVCDVVPLTGLNRAFVTQGLAILARGQNLGLATLSEVAGISSRPGVYELGFLLGPRINAGGRIGASDLGVKLLTAADPQMARHLAIELDRLNAERRELEAQMLHAAMDQAERSHADNPETPVVVVADKDWHPGIVGIIASRLKDKFHRPTFVIGLADDGTGTLLGKGSGRSIAGVDLGSAVLAAKDAGLLVNGGGHAMAAGLTIDADKIPSLASFLSDRLRDSVAANDARVKKIDAVLSATGAGYDLFAQMERAGPFGAGNAEPVVAISSVNVSYSDVVGDSHVKCTFTDPVSKKNVYGIAFRAMGTPLGDLLMNGAIPIHVVGKLRRDDWRGGRAVQLIVDDAAPAV